MFWCGIYGIQAASAGQLWHAYTANVSCDKGFVIPVVMSSKSKDTFLYAFLQVNTIYFWLFGA